VKLRHGHSAVQSYRVAMAVLRQQRLFVEVRIMPHDALAGQHRVYLLVRCALCVG
jgi:hypothetical protein